MRFESEVEKTEIEIEIETETEIKLRGTRLAGLALPSGRGIHDPQTNWKLRKRFSPPPFQRPSNPRPSQRNHAISRKGPHVCDLLGSTFLEIPIARL